MKLTEEAESLRFELSAVRLPLFIHFSITRREQFLLFHSLDKNPISSSSPFEVTGFAKLTEQGRLPSLGARCGATSSPVALSLSLSPSPSLPLPLSSSFSPSLYFSLAPPPISPYLSRPHSQTLPSHVSMSANSKREAQRHAVPETERQGVKDLCETEKDMRDVGAGEMERERESERE